MCKIFFKKIIDMYFHLPLQTWCVTQNDASGTEYGIRGVTKTDSLDEMAHDAHEMTYSRDNLGRTIEIKCLGSWKWKIKYYGLSSFKILIFYVLHGDFLGWKRSYIEPNDMTLESGVVKWGDHSIDYL